MPTEKINEKTSEYFHMASVCRFHAVDGLIREFIKEHGACNVVNLGCGLETAFFRIKPAAARFYEVDLPEVIDLRKSVFPQSENEIAVGCDMFSMKWAERIDPSLPTLFTASGVFMYFQEERVLKLFCDIKERFKNARIVFDAANKKGLDGANRHVKKTGNADAQMYFYVDDAADFARKSGTKLIKTIPFFTAARRELSKVLKLYTKAAMRFVDKSGMGKLIYLEF